VSDLCYGSATGHFEVVAIMTQVRRTVPLWGAWLVLGFLFLPAVFRSFTSRRLTWAVTDALINFRGGFVRRGLLGELILRFCTATGMSPFVVIATIFFLTTIVTAAALFWLLLPYVRRWPMVAALVLFSPALLLFPVHEFSAYARKESFVLIVLLLHAIVARRFAAGEISVERMRRFHILLLMPALTLCMFIHEVQLFFLPAHVGILFLAARQRAMPVRGLGLIFVPPVVAAMVLARFNGDETMIRPILESIRPIAGVPAEQLNAISALGWPVERFREVARFIWSDGSSMALYGGAFVLSVIVPALILGTIATRHAAVTDPLRKRWLAVMIAMICLVPLPLYVLGADFGRWIHLTAFSVIALLLSIPLAPTESSVPAPHPAFWSYGWVAAVFCGVYIFGWQLPHFDVEPDVLKSGMAGSLVRSTKLMSGRLGPPWTPGDGRRTAPSDASAAAAP
jgi:hypothetical protein